MVRLRVLASATLLATTQSVYKLLQSDLSMYAGSQATVSLLCCQKIPYGLLTLRCKCKQEYHHQRFVIGAMSFEQSTAMLNLVDLLIVLLDCLADYFFPHVYHICVICQQFL